MRPIVRLLNFKSIPVTIRTTRFTIQEFYTVMSWNLCVLYGSPKKEHILPYKTLKDRFL